MNSDTEEPDGQTCGAIDEDAAAAHRERMAVVYEREHRNLVRRLTGWAARSSRAPPDLGAEVADEAFGDVCSMENPPSSPEALIECLYKRANNLMNSRLKRDSHRGVLRKKFEEELVPSTRPLDQHHMDVQRKEILDRIVSTLSARKQRVLTLRIWHGLALGEIVAHLAEEGIYVNERTIRRDIDAVLDRCRAELSRLEKPTKEEAK